MAERILTRTERATAWLYTGALAHLVAGLTDWVVLLGTFARARWDRGRSRAR
jgi:hypothetical protein